VVSCDGIPFVDELCSAVGQSVSILSRKSVSRQQSVGKLIGLRVK